jgi:hypothetical protein
MSAHPSTAAQNHMAPDASIAAAAVVKQSSTPRLVVSDRLEGLQTPVLLKLTLRLGTDTRRAQHVHQDPAPCKRPSSRGYSPS